MQRKTALILLAMLLIAAVGCGSTPAASSGDTVIAASSSLPASSATGSSTPAAPVEAPESEPEGNAAAYKAMRDTTAYMRSTIVYNSDPEMQTLNTDPTARAIADLLSAADIAGDTFASPAALPSDRVVLACLQMTHGIARAGSPSYSDYPTSEEMEPIFVAVARKQKEMEEMVWVQEHLEQSARLLFGPDFVLQHQTVDKYRYFPEEGVYTPPHMGAGYEILTAVLDYTDNGDTVTATASYALQSTPGISALDAAGNGDWENPLPPQELADYLQNKAPRHTVTLKKNADGSFCVVSQAAAQ